jgi:hypothetical protein
MQLGGEFSYYTGFLPPYSFPLPLPSSLPFSLPILGGCQISTLEAPPIIEKAPCMHNSQSWAFATFFPFRYSLICYLNVAICYRYSATFQKFAIRYLLFATSFEQCNK